jgi:hypothetical protein
MLSKKLASLARKSQVIPREFQDPKSELASVCEPGSYLHTELRIVPGGKRYRHLYIEHL